MRKEADQIRKMGELLKAARLDAVVEESAARDERLISLVTCDSRCVVPGSCYVAVRGARVNGHAFVSDAVERGASLVVSEEAVGACGDALNIRVSDARSALARLAAAYHGFVVDRDGTRVSLVGVTGTNGKTTTAMLVRSILRAAGHRSALLGTVGYDLVGEQRRAEWTTPPAEVLAEMLAIARGHGATHAVLEVSSHAMDQRRCDGLRFDAGVFTNISGDHLDYHGDFEAYVCAKKRLFDGLDASAMAVVNEDDSHSAAMVADCKARVLRFGKSGNGDVSVRIVNESIRATEFDLAIEGRSVRVMLPLVGRYNVANAVAAAAAAHGLGIEPGIIREGLETVDVIPGRLQRVSAGDSGVNVFVDYAHTDDALVNVLSALRPLTRGRVICVFGCGGDRDQTKRPRMARAVEAGADVAIVTSDNPRFEDPHEIIEDILGGFEGHGACRVIVEPDRAVAIAEACRMAGDDDTVLVAGKGHEDYQIVGGEVFAFDDVAAATRALASARSVG